jgi:hypothetical protein
MTKQQRKSLWSIFGLCRNHRAFSLVAIQQSWVKHRPSRLPISEQTNNSPAENKGRLPREGGLIGARICRWQHSTPSSFHLPMPTGRLSGADGIQGCLPVECRNHQWSAAAGSRAAGPTVSRARALRWPRSAPTRAADRRCAGNVPSMLAQRARLQGSGSS